MEILIQVQLNIKLLIRCNHLIHTKNNDPNVLYQTVVTVIKPIDKLTQVVEIILNKQSKHPAS